ncbi:MAG: sulfatase [Lentisphaerae bacterium]|nr:sulfatase [Lentisphaerota bacterium]
MPQPNILFVFSDQHRKHNLGCYGDAQVRTPNLDSLARDGLRFEHCISNAPLCVPMRGSLLTGRYAWKHRAITNDLPVDPQCPSIAQQLAGAGYHTGYIGKWHLGGIPRSKAIPTGERLGFHEWKGANCNHVYNKGYYFDEDEQRHEIPGFQSVGETDLALDFIDRNSAAQQPWALFLAWSPPHEPFNAVPDEYLQLYEPQSLTLRPNVPAELHEQARSWLRAYYALITLLDDQFGRLLVRLDQLGIADNTIVIYTSDHGDMLGSHGLRNKQLPHEESIAVPLLARWPGHIPSGTREHLCSLTDLPVTIAALAGAAPWPGCDGQDLSAMWLNNDDGLAAALIYDLVPCHQAEDRGAGEWIGLRTPQWTFSQDGHGIPQLLFDNLADPMQLSNLAKQPAKSALIRDLQSALQQMLAAAGSYTFRPWQQMIREDAFLQLWNDSQRHFNRQPLTE